MYKVGETKVVHDSIAKSLSQQGLVEVVEEDAADEPSKTDKNSLRITDNTGKVKDTEAAPAKPQAKEVKKANNPKEK